jgi:hypothetical protein
MGRLATCAILEVSVVFMMMVRCVRTFLLMSLQNPEDIADWLFRLSVLDSQKMEDAKKRVTIRSSRF